MYRLVLIIAVLLALALAGCSKNAVTVEGVSIPESDINRIVTAQEQIMGPSAKIQEVAIRANVTQTLVNQVLLLQEAQKEGIKVPEDEVTQKYTELKNVWYSSVKAQESLEAQGYTVDNLEDQARNELLIDKLAQTVGKTQKQQIAGIQALLSRLKSRGK